MMSGPGTTQWTQYPGNPLIRPPFGSPVIADPTFCFPEESPDGQWHLYAHSVLGIHHHTSVDGINWKRREKVKSKALRPYLFQESGKYYLYYEQIHSLGLWSSFRPGVTWSSSFAMMESTDLKHWSAPQTVLQPSLPWHGEERLGQAVSNPCLVKIPGGYRLYYSASLVYVPDCGFNEPLYIGYAEGPTPLGPFTPAAQPLLQPDSRNSWCNLGAGSMKVIQVEHTWWAFQNGIYWQEDFRRSGSAVLLWSSADGLEWTQALPQPIIQPTKGWMSSHVYALDVRYRQSDKTWYLYFNARNGAHWSRGRECIGLLLGMG